MIKVGYYPEVIQHTNWDYGRNGKGYYNYIVYDLMKESPSSYVYRVSSLAIVDDVVTETKLAVEYETYDGPDYGSDSHL